jgi:hypothetical protein
VIKTAINISKPGILKVRYLLGLIASGTIREKISTTKNVRYIVTNIGIKVIIPAKK